MRAAPRSGRSSPSWSRKVSLPSRTPLPAASQPMRATATTWTRLWPESYGNVDQLLQGVSEGMSEVTRLLAVVAGPSALGGTISRVDYLPLREGAYLIVVSTEGGEASSTTITLPIYVEDEELREILASLNAFLGGRSIATNLELMSARRFLADYNPLAVGAVLEAVEVLSRATERGL